MPGVQNPHWEPWNAAMRLWMAWKSFRSLHKPSVVVIAQPSTEQTITKQELTLLSFTSFVSGLYFASITTHAPQPPAHRSSPLRIHRGELHALSIECKHERLGCCRLQLRRWSSHLQRPSAELTSLQLLCCQLHRSFQILWRLTNCSVEMVL